MSDHDKRLEKIKRLNQLREELYGLLDVYGIEHQKVLEFSKKVDTLILEIMQMEKVANSEKNTAN